MPETAVFVIDIQNGMATNAETKIPNANNVCQRASEIIDKVRGAIAESRKHAHEPDFALLFVQHEESPEEGPLNRGTEPWKIVFEPREDDANEMLVAKTTLDTFESNLALATQLKSAGVKKVVPFGMQSDACVRETSKGALRAGFEVTVLSGAHGTYDGEYDGVKLSADQISQKVDEELKSLGATVVSWENWLPARS